MDNGNTELFGLDGGGVFCGAVVVVVVVGGGGGGGGGKDLIIQCVGIKSMPTLFVKRELAHFLPVHNVVEKNIEQRVLAQGTIVTVTVCYAGVSRRYI